MDIVLLYLLLINALGFVLMLTDKYKAKNNRWRIPERSFFAIAVLGGSVGCLLGMYTVRHKTKHLSFTVLDYDEKNRRIVRKKTLAFLDGEAFDTGASRLSTEITRALFE